MIAEAQLDEIAAALDQRFGLVALWLFGSEAAGRARADSDVDLAALFVDRIDPVELQECRAELAERLGRDVDLVDLQRASPALGMQVLRHGRLCADRDPTARLRFVAALPGRYDDLRHLRAPIERLIRERLDG